MVKYCTGSDKVGSNTVYFKKILQGYISISVDVCTIDVGVDRENPVTIGAD